MPSTIEASFCSNIPNPTRRRSTPESLAIRRLDLPSGLAKEWRQQLKSALSAHHDALESDLSSWFHQLSGMLTSIVSLGEALGPKSFLRCVRIPKTMGPLQIDPEPLLPRGFASPPAS